MLDAKPSSHPDQVGTEKGGGFLGFGGNKKIDEGKRQQLAQAAYQKGAKAINKYIEIGNDGMGLQARAVPRHPWHPWHPWHPRHAPSCNP